MLLALGTKNKLGFINGTCVKSTTDAVLSAQWDRCNIVVLSWILGTLTEELYSGQNFNSLALNVWNDLNKTYDKKDGSVIFNLHHKINSLKQNDSPLSEYNHNLNSSWKQYDSMVSSPPCTCGADACTCLASVSVENNNKMMKLMQFFMGLNDAYMPIRSNILLRDRLPDAKVTYAIISREESHRISSLKDSNSKSQSSAFVAHGPNKTNSNNVSSFNTNIGPNPNLKCKKCNKIGHTIERCFEIVGYPPNFRKNFNNNNNRSQNNYNNFRNTSNNNDASNENNINSSSPISFSQEQMLKLLSLINDSSVPASTSAMSNMEGTFFNSSVKFNLNFNKFFNSNLSQSKPIQNGWIIDSGANQHMTTTSNGLSDVVDISGLKLSVGHPNEYCVTLMSVCKLSKDNKLTVSFNESTCYVQGLKDKIIKGIGKEEETQFNKQVKMSRNDNGTEFVNQKMNNHTNSKACYLINMTPSPVLGGKSPYELIFKTEPSLSHLRCFGCLRFSVSLNPADKFSSSPNDEGRATDVCDGSSDNSHENENSPTATHLEDNTSSPEGTNNDLINVGSTTLRRSTRSTTFPKKYDDFVLDGKVKYGIERVVNYANLKSENVCFVSNLNKNLEPKSYEQACKDPKWVEAMNLEIEALNRNNIWEITDLPDNTKPIGNKWVYRVKYKLMVRLKDIKQGLWLKVSIKRKGLIMKKLLALLNRKSVTGYLVYFCDTLVSWKSKKQSVVSRSSAEAEYRAMATTVCEIIWIKNLLLDFNIKVKLPVKMFCDNSSAIQISANHVFHEKTKHFDIDLHFLREKISTGIVQLFSLSGFSIFIFLSTLKFSVFLALHHLDDRVSDSCNSLSNCGINCCG
ncbi:uncharacterized protein [Rutidosis leptorrhynchoides]|uniref:uncharacterized protein n=1 Tax=Rutidosis leptorrhynchoides TaxID=125765 RepID=UPI003A998065